MCISNMAPGTHLLLQCRRLFAAAVMFTLDQLTSLQPKTSIPQAVPTHLLLQRRRLFAAALHLVLLIAQPPVELVARI